MVTVRAFSSKELARRLHLDRYPRSNRYDPAWVVEHMMGPHPLWLMEHLTTLLPLQPGQRVMDLGCGKALTSIFLAREFDVRVHAVDLWIGAGENLARIEAAGEADRVVPIYADANDLPFAEGSFDAIVSVDAYHYFGTGPDDLPKIVRFLTPGGRLGIVVPGLTHEIPAVPESLAPFWEKDFSLFHSADWWRELWERSGAATIEYGHLLEHGAADWLLWSEASDDWKRTHGQAPYLKEAEMLRADAGRFLGFVALVARRDSPCA